MGLGYSKSVADSTQTANANLTQQYSGSCNIQCNNEMNNVSVDIVNSQIGGDVEVTQVCSVNGQCMFNTSQNAVVDVMFKAANSTTAGNAGSWLAGLYNKDFSSSKSYQEINENIQQTIDQTCNITSTNSMNNVSIYAANSQIGGNVVIDQQNNAQGGCTLQTSMSATAMATGTADNCALTGKKAKKSCGGKGGAGIVTYILYIGGAFLLFMVAMMVIRAISNRTTPPKLPGALPSSIAKLPIAPLSSPSVAKIPALP